MKASFLLIGLTALFVPYTNTAPTSQSNRKSSQKICQPIECRPSADSQNFKFVEGQTYSYGFSSEVSTKILGTSEDESKIGIRGEFLLSANSPCDIVLRVNRASFQRPTKQITDGVREFEGSSIRFSYQNGAVERICTSESDPTWSANIKRALVSMFQNKAEQIVGDASVSEVDISGRCPTTYSVNGNTYTKTKSLNSCSYRDGGFWVQQGVPYKINSDSNSSPVINSTQTCTQTLSPSGVINNVDCTEEHLLIPLSSQKTNGVISSIKSSINLQRTTGGSSNERTLSTLNSPSSLFYDHEDNFIVSEEVKRGAQQAGMDLTGQICRETKNGRVTEEVPSLANNLRRALKQISDARAILSIYKSIPSDNVCSKLFLHTVAKVGTPASIEFMTEMIGSKKVDKETQSVFSMYSSYALRPDAASLAAYTKLITGNNVLEPEVILGASGLAHRFCAQNDCGNVEEYVQLTQSIAQIVGESCLAQEEKSIKLAVLALQALGNLDDLPPGAVSTLKKCISGGGERIKIRALDAFRRDPCEYSLKESSYEIFERRTESSEVRIGAYLALMRCMEQDDVSRIQKTINNEKSNQVGSFVSSHISSVLSSSSPSSKNLQGALKQLNVPSQFPNDPRKFSTHFESSAFSEDRNLGYSAQGNLIYSQDSFIPRMLSANLTTDMFGRSYNFLEMGVYLEDFEHMVENYFGPSAKEESARSRPRRALDLNNLDRFTGLKNKFGTNGVGDFYMRIFGTTLDSTSFSQDEKMSGSLMETFKKLAQGTRDSNIELLEPFTFLDENLIVPTTSGLPLNVELDGTALLSLQLKGSLDITPLLRSSGYHFSSTRVLPSAVGTVRGKMSIGSGPLESGISLLAQIHSAASLDLSLKRELGKLEVKLNFPEERIETLSLKSQLLVVEAEGTTLKSTQLQTNSKKATPMCGVSESLGVRACAAMEIPTSSLRDASSFLLAGDTVIDVYVEKTEASMEGYYLLVDTTSTSSDEDKVSVVFDTPGSKTNRRITGDGRLINGRSPKIELDIKSPSQNMRFDYQRWNEVDVKGLEVKVKNDGSEYSTLAKLKIDNSGEGGSYMPELSYVLPGGGEKLIEGKIDYRSYGREMDIDLTIAPQRRGLSNNKIAGSIKMERKDRSSSEYQIRSLKLENDALGKFHLDGDVRISPNSLYSLNMKTNYGADAQHDLGIKSELSYPQPSSTRFDIAISSSRRSFLNFDLKYESERLVNGFSNSLVAHRGTGDQVFTLEQSAKYDIESTKRFTIDNVLKVSHPKRGIDFSLMAQANNGEQQNALFDLKLSSDVSSRILYKTSGDEMSDYEINAQLKYPGREVLFSEKARKVESTRWNYVTSLESQSGSSPPFTFKADTDLVLKYERDDTTNELSSQITSSALQEPITFKSNLLAKKESYQASFRINRPSGDVVNFASDYKRSQGNNLSKFSSKVFVLSYLNLNVEESHGRGSSNLKLDADWLPTGRKFLINSLMKKGGETYDVDASVEWDAARDATKSASLKSSFLTTPNRGGVAIDSKNTFVIMGVERELNFVTRIGGDVLNSENSADITYRTPQNTYYKFNLGATNENKDRSKGTLIKFKYSPPEAELNFEGEITSRAFNVDLSQYVFEVVNSISLRNNEHFINFNTEIHSTRTNKMDFSALFDISGSNIKEGLRGEFSTEIQSGKYKVGGLLKKGNTNGDFLAELEHNFWATKKSFDAKFLAHLPFESLRDAGAEISYSYFYSSFTNFDIQESGFVSFNGQQLTSWNNKMSFLNNDFNANMLTTTFGKPVIDFRATGIKNQKKFSVKATNIVSRNEEMKINLDFERVNPTAVSAKIALITPFQYYENVELLVRHKYGGEESSGMLYNTNFQFIKNKQRSVLVTKIESNEERKKFEVHLTESSIARKFLVGVSGLRGNKLVLDSMINWGKDEFIQTKGSILRTDGNFEGNLNMHSPVLKIDNWNVVVLKTKESGKNKITFNVLSAQASQAIVELTYAQKREATVGHTSYDGSLSVKATNSKLAMDWMGKFSVSDKIFDGTLSNERGREIGGSFTLDSPEYPVTVSVKGKRSNLETVLYSSLCSSEGNENCKAGEIKWKDVGGETEFSALTKFTESGEPTIDGVIFKNRKRNSRTPRPNDYFEQSLRILTHASSEDDEDGFGYHVLTKIQSRDEEERLFEIYLPERVMSAKYNYKYESGILRTVEIWMDKNRQPNEKLKLVLNAQKFTLSFIASHPRLNKDVKLELYVRGITERGSDIKLTVDVFTNEPLVIGLNVVMPADAQVDGEDYYRATFDMTGFINMNAISNVRIFPKGGFKTNTKIGLRNSLNQMRSYEFYIDNDKNGRKFELLSPESKVISLSSSYNYHLSAPNSLDYDSYDVRREIYLPGMKDSRIFQSSIGLTFPQRLSVKTYTSSSPPGDYYEGWIGFKNEKEFLVGVYGNENRRQSPLAEVGLALNSSRLLFVKTELNADKIRNFMNDVQTRISDTSSRYQSQLFLSDYTKNEINVVALKLSNSVPDLSPLSNYYASQIDSISSELTSAKYIQFFDAYLEFIFNALGGDYSNLVNLRTQLVSVLRDGAKEGVKLLFRAPQGFVKLIESIPNVLRMSQEGVSLMVDGVSNSFYMLSKWVNEGFDRISEYGPEIAGKMEYLRDTSRGIGKFLRDALEKSLNIFSQIFTQLRSSASSFFNSATILNYIRESFAGNYEKVLTDLISEYKDEFEELRKSFLKALPNTESQELFRTILEYFERKANGERVNDGAELNRIYAKFVEAIEKLKESIFTIDLRGGLILAQVPLPVSIKSLPDISNSLNSLRMPSYKIKRPSGYGILEVYNKVKTATSFRDLFPPYSATGLLIGSQYYKTFDDEFYHLEGKCQYVLAADFIDRNFSAVVDYSSERRGENGEVKKSIILTNQKDIVTIKHDNTILVNERSTEVPVTYGDFKIERRDDWVVVKVRGIMVKCSGIQDVCLFKINGFFQGKTNGLLGTYNNEQFDDFSSPSGQILESKVNMGPEWKVEKRCRDSVVSSEFEKPDPISEYKCREAFTGKSSPLRPCFSVVDPKDYQSVCESISNKNGYYPDRAVCAAAYGYKEICSSSNVKIDTADLCEVKN